MHLSRVASTNRDCNQTKSVEFFNQRTVCPTWWMLKGPSPILSSGLHWTILVLFCVLFIQWSMFPLIHIFELILRPLNHKAYYFILIFFT